MQDINIYSGILLLSSLILSLLPGKSIAQSGHQSENSSAIEIALTERTTTDVHGISIAAFLTNHSESLILPGDIDTSKVFFTSIFNRQDLDDGAVAILVLPTQEGEWLYIDSNNDEDLTNDGDPLFFPKTENEFSFLLNETLDPDQAVGRIFYRTPQSLLLHPESEAKIRADVVDVEGNLQPSFRERMTWLPDAYTGEKGTYYFKNRLSLRRGYLVLEGDTIDIGLYDYSENGRFDDPDDQLYLDLDGDRKLGLYWANETFKLNDVVGIKGSRYKLSHVDPYGRNVIVEQTDEDPTFYYVTEQVDRQIDGFTGQLDTAFWELEFEDLHGERIDLADLRGRYILLNFWGEWCAPCMEELPDLVSVDAKTPDTELQMIGMLLTYDQEGAEQVIAEQGMKWPQVLLTEEIQEQFKVQSYPTNILIFPDGTSFVKAGQINEQFIEHYIK